jgi:hypothetical protein
VHHSTIRKEISNKMQQYPNFIIPHLYEAQHVSGDTPSIIRSLKLHSQPLVFHTWKVVGRVVGVHLSGTDTVPDKCTPHIQLLNIKWNKNSLYLPYEPSFSLSSCRRCYLPCCLAHFICICLNCKYATPYSINT